MCQGDQGGLFGRERVADMVDALREELLEKLLVEPVRIPVERVPRASPSVPGVPDEGHSPAVRILDEVLAEAVVIEGSGPAADGVQDRVAGPVREGVHVGRPQVLAPEPDDGGPGVAVMVDEVRPGVQSGDDCRAALVPEVLVELRDGVEPGRHIEAVDVVLPEA